MNNISKRLLILLPIILIIQIANAQTGNDCGCGEYPASVTVETVGDPCSPPDLGNDDGSLKRVYEHECCMKKCKENRVNTQSTDISTKTKTTSNQTNSTLTNKDLTKKLRGSQNQLTVNQNDLNQRLTESLTTTFNQISESWAKERDFQNKISSLTNIKSVDATSIINEAKSKAQQINVSYSQKKNEALNQSVNVTQNLMKSAKNEEQVVAGGVIGTLGTVISQSNLEKQRKEAQEKLEKEKEYALKRIAKEITDKYNPIKDKHLEAAIYAVQKDKEEYHLANYEYAKCMSDNALDIIVKDVQCKKPKIVKPIIKTSFTGQEYYDAYKRKKSSSIKSFNVSSEAILELAIEKDTSNDKWLFEKFLFDDRELKTLTLYSLNRKKPLILRVLELNPNNLNYVSKYKELEIEIAKREKINLEREAYKDAKPFMVINEIPTFPGCKKKRKLKSCFSEKIREHFNKNFNIKVNRIFINLVLKKDGTFLSAESHKYDEVIFDEISRVTKLLPKLNSVSTSIRFSFPFIME